MSKHIGKVVQVIGPVLDVRFQEGELPALLNAIEIHHDGKTMIAEVAQHIGDNVARRIAMSSTDGLVRGADAVDTDDHPAGTAEIRLPEDAGRDTLAIGQIKVHFHNRHPHSRRK